jgi:cation:H+ antiporter
MPAEVAVPAFLAGALVSLATSWVLVSRLERVGERLGLSEALLGIVAALAADAPEVTAAFSAIAGHQQRLGAGVVIGSNVFNLAALLGLGAVAAGRIRLHRRVVVLGGAVAVCVGIVCMVVVLGAVPPVAGFVLVLAIIALYAVVLSAGETTLARFGLPAPWIASLRAAVAEEEAELEDAIRPARGRRQDVVVAVLALLVVVVASVTMERAASALGSRFAIPEIVVGGLVLAAVTSLPNAVAAVYLAARGRGAATLSTALNSNTLNVALGLLLPATVIGLGAPTGQTTLITAWYVGLTAAVLVIAYRDRGIGRQAGIVIIGAYVIFAGSVLIAVRARDGLQIAIAGGAAVTVVFVIRVVSGLRRDSGEPDGGAAGTSPPAGEAAAQIAARSLEPPVNGSSPARACTRAPGLAQLPLPAPQQKPSLVSGWPAKKLWTLGVAISVVVAGTDAALGHRVILIGLLVAGPCCVLLTGRWVMTGLTGLWVIALAVVLGLPDGIWGTATQLAFLGAVAAVALMSTLAAVVIEIRTPPVRPH